MKDLLRMQVTHEFSFEQMLNTCGSRLNNLFKHLLIDIPSLKLKTAMEYTLLNNSGKRIRPMLIYASGSIFAASWQSLDIPACAVELIHTYSLIHDDLPCMDNADLRRGKPACHKAYGEDMAVLTGDALHTLAMHIISAHPAPLNKERRLEMMKILSQACGPYGMAAGQALDISVMHDMTISADLLIDIYRLKTGALISACVELGRLASNDDNDQHKQALLNYSQNLGLAFQIQDDILDMEATAEISGKPQGLDSENNKATFPKLFGLTKAKNKVESLYEEALEAIDYLGERAQMLRQLTGFMLRRKS